MASTQDAVPQDSTGMLVCLLAYSTYVHAIGRE